MIGVTHNGRFHADDVFATVVLRKIFPEIEVIRSRDPKTIARADIVYDVGNTHDPERRLFDHHQNGAPKRENGITYSSFGLIWREYGEEYCGSVAIAKVIDERLVQLIDADDNGDVVTRNVIPGVKQLKISEIIGDLNPLPLTNERDKFDQQFEIAVDMAREILDRMVAKARDSEYAIAYVGRGVAKDDERFAILDTAIELSDNISQAFPSLLYIVLPDTMNRSWNVVALRKTGAEFDVRKPFPASWAGLRNSKMSLASGVKDATFCHKNLFIVASKSRDGAIELLRRSLEA